jgi:hypothetical protein
MRTPLPPAYPLSRYFGKRYYRFQVRVTQSGVHRTYWEFSQSVPVIASSAPEACRLIKDEIAAKVDQPTEIECAGVKGGITSRFIGYESLIWARMCAGDTENNQLVFAYAKNT